MLTVSQTRESCPSRELSCDKLLIRGINSLIGDRGVFSVRYTPGDGSSETITQVFYGPEGIYFIGGDEAQVDAESNIIFEARIPFLSLSRATVCERVDGGTFMQSRLLSARSNVELSDCVASTFGRPYVISVHLDDNAPPLTSPRTIQIVVTFGSCIHLDGTKSAPLNVTVYPPTTSSTPSPSITTQPATQTTISDTAAPTTAAPHITSDVLTVENTTNEDDLFTSTPTPHNLGGVSRTSLIVIIMVVVVIMVVAVLAVSVGFAIFLFGGRKKRSKRPIKNGVQTGTQNHYQDSTGGRDMADSGIVADDRRTPSVNSRGESSELNHTVALCRDLPTTAGVAGVTAAGVAVAPRATSYSATNPIHAAATLGIRDRGSISETESEGSDVNLLRDIRNNTQRIASGMNGIISITADSNMKIQNLERHTEDISDTIDYVADRLDGSVIGQQQEREQVTPL